MRYRIPDAAFAVAKTLSGGGFQAYLVGGCVRDLFLGRAPSDWDIATDAKPKEIQELFSESVYENQFGTVAVKTDEADPTLRIVEVTTFRKEGGYTDKRHPDSVTFAGTIEADLARRDFTINAIALKCATSNANGIVDPFNGQKDLKSGFIRAVGDPSARFSEDALRLLRAVRLAAELGFAIEEYTAASIKEHAHLLEFVARERVRDEFQKIILSSIAADGIRNLFALGLLRYVLPELEAGIGIMQNKHHIYTVFEHNLRSLEYAAEKAFTLPVRLAALLHDVGKPKAKRGEGPESTFYGHQVIGERIAIRALDRLRFSRELIEQVVLLIREHMFVYDPDTVTLAGVRRLIRRVGTKNIDDLFKVRESDRIGSGVPKAQPYRLRYLKAMVEKVQQDPIHPKMLAVRGDDVIKILGIEPGPRVGSILAVLLEDVLDDPARNKREILEERVRELSKLSDAELKKFAEKARGSAAKAQERIDAEIKKKYFVK